MKRFPAINTITEPLPSTCLRTVHTAFGLPGSSDTAISDTWEKEQSQTEVLERACSEDANLELSKDGTKASSANVSRLRG